MAPAKRFHNVGGQLCLKMKTGFANPFGVCALFRARFSRESVEPGGEPEQPPRVSPRITGEVVTLPKIFPQVGAALSQFVSAVLLYDCDNRKNTVSISLNSRQ